MVQDRAIFITNDQ